MFTEFLAGLAALESLLGPIAAFIVAVHPDAGQEAARAATAVSVATQALQVAGLSASTIAALQPVVTVAAGAIVAAKTAPVA